VLRSEKYTTKADVYSFGVVLWEMFARADPYGTMSALQIAYAVSAQSRRPAVDPAWPAMWLSMMQMCWAEQPDGRPDFSTLLDKILDMEFTL